MFTDVPTVLSLDDHILILIKYLPFLVTKYLGVVVCLFQNKPSLSYDVPNYHILLKWFSYWRIPTTPILLCKWHMNEVKYILFWSILNMCWVFIFLYSKTFEPISFISWCHCFMSNIAITCCKYLSTYLWKCFNGITFH